MICGGTRDLSSDSRGILVEQKENFEVLIKKQLCPVRRTPFFCFTSSGTTETRTRTNKNLKNPSNECAQCCPHKHNRGGLTEEPHTVTHSDSHTHVKTHEECWVFREDGSVYCQ